ncbi:isochorismatase family protein [Chromobacterium violaceum]|uniref:Nicotinamidase/pyrazinamidase n=2 Tax=Chromobacterium violaceum TaxID=536 RepID=A0AAX2M8X7_CHRVL|nr:isochorismatase family protein [Chromobacterium violaceum]AAQ59576.1 probable hydrolase [Chromobacterium violaceum ATCC 12472]KJH67142.1 hydrolase [Chromobacterium violaceum]KMN51016.1 hydrolase [Chromobacterium violaceum]KMN86295.1 hydrolase [Chromobacterium violaceum]KMN89859.1 hydrolase [Chromobacterium violaceum]
MKKTALLVIDVQDSFLHRPYWDERELPAYRDAQLRLIAGAEASGVPVVNILHTDDDEAFRLESGLVKPQSWLKHRPAASFVKHVHNALTDSGLQDWLIKHGIQKLVISGIRTEQCCETTTRVASDLGYEVDFVTEATLTFPMTHAGSGAVYSAADIRARTELVLAGRFATIVTVEEALRRMAD